MDPLLPNPCQSPLIDSVMMPHLIYAISLTLITYLAIRFPYARYIIVVGPLFHPEVWSNVSLLKPLFQVKILIVVPFVVMHAFKFIRVPGWVFTWVWAVNIFWCAYIEITRDATDGTDQLVRTLNAILLFLTACSTPWFRSKEQKPAIPLPLGVKDESDEDDEDFILQDKTQAWFQVPYICALIIMHMYSMEFEHNCKVYLGIYSLILPVLVQFLAGDARYFIEARAYALYIVFMIAGMQCWLDSSCCEKPLDDIHKRLYDVEWTWMFEIRHSNTWSWMLLAVAAILCCYAWSKMNLKDTFLGILYAWTLEHVAYFPGWRQSNDQDINDLDELPTVYMVW